MHKAQSEYLCRDRGGVYRMGNPAFRVRCNDGTYHTYENGMALPEGWRVTPD